MAFEPFMQIVRGLYGKRNGVGLGQLQNPQQMAYLRNLQKEMNQEEDLYIPLSKLPIVVFDIETTGFYPDRGDSILSIGAVKMKGTEVMEQETFYSLANYDGEIPEEIVNLTGITNDDVKTAPPLSEVLLSFFKFTQDSTLVAHHANHERSFMQHFSPKLLRTPFKHRIVDTAFLYKIVEPNSQLVSLEDLCMYNDIAVENRHHALSDAIMTAKLWAMYVEKAKALHCETLQDVYSQFAKR